MNRNLDRAMLILVCLGCVSCKWLVGSRECRVEAEARCKGANFAKRNLRGANLSRADLHAADLSEADLSFANMEEADLSGARLRHTELVGTNLRSANLRGSLMGSSNAQGADFSRAFLVEAEMDHVILSQAILRNAVLNNADVSHSYLVGTVVEGASFKGAKLVEAEIDTRFTNTDFTGADFQDAFTPKEVKYEIGMLEGGGNRCPDGTMDTVDGGKWRACRGHMRRKGFEYAGERRSRRVVYWDEGWYVEPSH